jgi:sulfate transport system permease protein
MSRADRAPRRHGPVEVLLVAVVVAYALLLLVGPLVAIVWGALSHGAGVIARELTSESALGALWLTLVLSVTATAVNTVFGTAVAWVMVRHEFPGKRLLNGLIDLPFAVSPVIGGFMLILLFGRNGWLAPVTDALGVKVVFAVPGMLLATIFVSLPFVIREVIPVLAQIGTEQESAAYTLGAGPWQTFRRVTLPSIRWGMLYGVSLTFARALGEFGAVLVVGGGVARLTETSTLFIFRSLDDRNEAGAYSMALLLGVISFTVLMGMEFFKKRAHSE